MAGENILDVAVVGGGISGVYSAWRLLSDGDKKLVTVYEADKHIGGRLLSVKPPGIDNMVAELGGMRILPECIQPLINTLISKLNFLANNSHSDITHIDLYDFPVNDSHAPENPASDNIVFARGASFRWSDIGKNPEKIPYKLPETEKSKSLGDIILEAIKIILNDPEIDNRIDNNKIDNRFLEEVRKKLQTATYG